MTILRRLTDTMALFNRGRFAERCAEHLTDAIQALEALPTEKGSATITIVLKLEYEAGRLDIWPSVKSRLPEERGFPANTFWIVDGGLSVQHPSQTEMFGGPEAVEDRQRRRAGDA